MSNLTLAATAVSNPWTESITPNLTSDKKITLNTKDLYLDRNIELTIKSLSTTPANFVNITTSDVASAVPIVDTAGYTGTRSIDGITIPASKKLDVTLTAGTSSVNTILNVNRPTSGTTYTHVYLKGGTESSAFVTLASGNSISTFYWNGVINTVLGTGVIKNLGNSSTASTLNVITNTYGTINVWGGKTADKGVTIANHVVTVDGDGTNAGTAVTNSSGDLIKAATPALAITDSSTAITPTAISGDTSKYNITTSVTGKTTYTTAGWIATTGLAAATDSSATVGTIIAGSISALDADVTVPSEKILTSVPRGRKFKVSKGWYPDDLYYQAQADAHSAWNIPTDYYTTTNTGYGTVTANTYTPNSTYYIKAGEVNLSDTTLSISPSVIPTSTVNAENGDANIGTIDMGAKTTTAPTTKVYISVTGGNSATTGSATSGESCTVTKTAGWIAAGTSTISSTATASAEENTTTAYYPLNGVTIKKPSSGERTFYIEVPNGTGTIKFYFHVKDDGNVYVTDSATAV